MIHRFTIDGEWYGTGQQTEWAGGHGHGREPPEVFKDPTYIGIGSGAGWGWYDLEANDTLPHTYDMRG